MQLAQRHIIKSTEHRFTQIDELAFKSKNLYNAANYVIRQSFVIGVKLRLKASCQGDFRQWLKEKWFST